MSQLQIPQIKDLKEKGFTLNSNWLNEQEIIFLKKIILSMQRQKGDKRSHLPFKKSQIFLKLIQAQLQDIKLGLYLYNLSKKLKLIDISNSFFEKESELVNIDYYVSKKSNEPVLDWHVDKAYSGKENVSKFVKADDYGLKFIFYLTDVSFENGSLNYIPYSNKVAFALKKAIYKNEINYSPYWKMKDFLNLIMKNKKIVLKYVRESIFEKFILNMEHLKSNEQVENFSNKIDKGGAIIFDESGIHKGTAPSFNDRIIFRYIFKKK